MYATYYYLKKIELLLLFVKYGECVIANFDSGNIIVFIKLELAIFTPNNNKLELTPFKINARKKLFIC